MAKKRSIHLHLTGDALPQDVAGKSTSDLLRIVKDPSAHESLVGAAIKELAKRGVDPRSGKVVGFKEAQRIAQEMGDLASG